MNDKKTPEQLRAALVAALDARDHEAAADAARRLRLYCDRAGVLAKWLVVDALLDSLASYCSHRVETMHRELLPVLVSYAAQAFDRTAEDAPLWAVLALDETRARFEKHARERMAHMLLAYSLDRAALVGEAEIAAAAVGPALPFEPEEGTTALASCANCNRHAVGLDAACRPVCARCAGGA